MNDKGPIQIPSWFLDTDMPQACLCGRPLEQGEQYLVAESEGGERRWFHLMCWQMMMDSQEDEDEW